LSIVAADPATHGQLARSDRLFCSVAPGSRTHQDQQHQVIHEMRMAMREVGRRMVELGAFDEIEDFGFVREAEMPTLFEDPHSMTEAIVPAAPSIDSCRSWSRRSVFVGHADGPDTWPRRDAATVDRLCAGETIAGMARLPRVRRGNRRVILDSNDPSALEPGDVLIAPITDPSWTPLFVPRRAVVVDVGAALESRHHRQPRARHSVRRLGDRGHRKHPRRRRVRVDGNTGWSRSCRCLGPRDSGRPGFARGRSYAPIK
jgi:pyruvate,water dikinase